MRFAVDCMLGTLAKWLRVLGHDVAYYRAIEDADLADIAAREGRTLLTADRRLVRRRRARDHVLITSQDLRQQITQVLRERRLTISSESLLGRCLRCNAITEAVPPGDVRDRVPIYVFRTQERFTRCPVCARVYWRATHVTRMLETLAAAAAGAQAPRPAVAPRAAGTPARPKRPPAWRTRPHASTAARVAAVAATPAADPAPSRSAHRPARQTARASARKPARRRTGRRP